MISPPYLFSSFQLAHKALMHRFYLPQSQAAAIAVAQQLHTCYNRSFSVFLLYVDFFDRPNFLLPSKCNVIDVKYIMLFSTLSTCPFQFFFLSVTILLILDVFILCWCSSFEILLGHLTHKIFLRYLFWKALISLCLFI